MELARVRYAAMCLTHDCNLRCKYCYAGRKSAQGMFSATARQALDFLAAQANGPCTVTFFGGEPLIEFNLIREIVAQSEQRHGRKIRFRMSTNGTLLNAAKIAFCREHELYFVLSLDGDERQHDANRRFASGRGSYQAVVRHLPEVFDFNPYTMAVSVISPDTVELVGAGVRDLFARGFRYVLQTLDYSAGWDRSHIRLLEAQYKEIATHYFEALREGNRIYYSPFDERIKTWAQKPYANGDLCDLANSQIAIAASGRIYPCVQFIGEDGSGDQQHAIGDVFAGFDTARRRHYISENYAEKTTCQGCALAGRCATYCGCVNWRATGDLKLIPPIVCEHERMLMPIVDRLANRLWRQNVPLFRHKFYDRAFPVSSYIDDCLRKREVQ